MRVKNLTETPVVVDVNKSKMWLKMTNILDENNFTIDDFDETKMKDVYLYESVYASMYIHYTTKDGITAFMFFSQDGIKHNGKRYGVVKQGDTLNLKGKFKNFTLEIFKDVSKRYKRPVMIDDKNSKDMKNVFIKWVSDPIKYGISNFVVNDSNLGRTLFDDESLDHDLWEEFLRAKKYTIVFDFYNYLNESNVSMQDNRLKGTKLWYDGE